MSNWDKGSYEVTAEQIAPATPAVADAVVRAVAEFAERYDLILGNPPYFLPREGKPSPVKINQHARFFMDADFQTLIEAVKHSLKPGGEAYLLVKDARGDAGEVVGDIRGTKVIRILSTNNPYLINGDKSVQTGG